MRKMDNQLDRNTLTWTNCLLQKVLKLQTYFANINRLYLVISCPLQKSYKMIHFFDRSHTKKPESRLFSDWIGNNTDDLRCSDWPKPCHPLVVVVFSLQFCLHNEQWIHLQVCDQISASSVFFEFEECLNRNCIHWNIFHFIVY